MEGTILPLSNWDMGPVSRKSRHFSDAFQVTSVSLYLQSQGVSKHDTLHLFLFYFIPFTTYEKTNFTE